MCDSAESRLDYIDCDMDDHYITGSFISPIDLQNIHNINTENILTLSIDYFKKLISNSQYEDIAYILLHDKETKIYTNMVDADDDTLLHMAIYVDKYNIAELLLINNANPNKIDKRGQSPIFRTVFVKNIKYIELLLQYGADINLCDVDGNTALHMAVSAQNVSIIQCLLNNGIHVNVKNNNGLYALDYVKASDFLTNKEIIKLFDTIK